MLHVFTYIIFILLFTTWLGYELKRKLDIKKYWLWILAACVSGVIGYTNYYYVSYDTFGNFILHMSGGVSVVCLFIYAMKTLRLRFRFRITTLLLFFFVSTLGVLNELLEYAMETVGFGIMSLDSHDTWRDFIANTLGMALAWGVYYAYIKLARKNPADPLY